MNPLPLRIRDEADLAEQRTRHRLTALAKSLHASHTLQPIRAPSSAPHAPARTQAAGGADWQHGEALRARLTVLHLERNRYRRAGNPARVQQLSREISLTEARLRTVARELSEVRTHRPAPPGLPNLYVIEVAPLLVLGPDAESLPGKLLPAETWLLDTRALPTELRERLNCYLLGGRDAAPYRYVRARNRYWPYDGGEACREIVTALWGHVAAGYVQR